MSASSSTDRVKGHKSPSSRSKASGYLQQEAGTNVHGIGNVPLPSFNPFEIVSTPNIHLTPEFPLSSDVSDFPAEWQLQLDTLVKCLIRPSVDYRQKGLTTFLQFLENENFSLQANHCKSFWAYLNQKYIPLLLQHLEDQENSRIIIQEKILLILKTVISYDKKLLAFHMKNNSTIATVYAPWLAISCRNAVIDRRISSLARELLDLTFGDKLDQAIDKCLPGIEVYLSEIDLLSSLTQISKDSLLILEQKIVLRYALALSMYKKLPNSILDLYINIKTLPICLSISSLRPLVYQIMMLRAEKSADSSLRDLCAEYIITKETVYVSIAVKYLSTLSATFWPRIRSVSSSSKKGQSFPTKSSEATWFQFYVDHLYQMISKFSTVETFLINVKYMPSLQLDESFKFRLVLVLLESMNKLSNQGQQNICKDSIFGLCKEISQTTLKSVDALKMSLERLSECLSEPILGILTYFIQRLLVSEESYPLSDRESSLINSLVRLPLPLNISAIEEQSWDISLYIQLLKAIQKSFPVIEEWQHQVSHYYQNLWKSCLPGVYLLILLYALDSLNVLTSKRDNSFSSLEKQSMQHFQLEEADNESVKLWKEIVSLNLENSQKNTYFLESFVHLFNLLPSPIPHYLIESLPLDLLLYLSTTNPNNRPESQRINSSDLLLQLLQSNSSFNCFDQNTLIIRIRPKVTTSCTLFYFSYQNRVSLYTEFLQKKGHLQTFAHIQNLIEALQAGCILGPHGLKLAHIQDKGEQVIDFALIEAIIITYSIILKSSNILTDANHVTFSRFILVLSSTIFKSNLEIDGPSENDSKSFENNFSLIQLLQKPDLFSQLYSSLWNVAFATSHSDIPLLHIINGWLVLLHHLNQNCQIFIIQYMFCWEKENLSGLDAFLYLISFYVLKKSNPNLFDHELKSLESFYKMDTNKFIFNLIFCRERLLLPSGKPDNDSVSLALEIISSLTLSCPLDFPSLSFLLAWSAATVRILLNLHEEVTHDSILETFQSEHIVLVTGSDPYSCQLKYSVESPTGENNISSLLSFMSIIEINFISAFKILATDDASSFESNRCHHLFSIHSLWPSEYSSILSLFRIKVLVLPPPIHSQSEEDDNRLSEFQEIQLSWNSADQDTGRLALYCLQLVATLRQSDLIHNSPKFRPLERDCPLGINSTDYDIWCLVALFLYQCVALRIKSAVSEDDLSHLIITGNQVQQGLSNRETNQSHIQKEIIVEALLILYQYVKFEQLAILISHLANLCCRQRDNRLQEILIPIEVSMDSSYSLLLKPDELCPQDILREAVYKQRTILHQLFVHSAFSIHSSTPNPNTEVPLGGLLKDFICPLDIDSGKGQIRLQEQLLDNLNAVKSSNTNFLILLADMLHFISSNPNILKFSYMLDFIQDKFAKDNFALMYILIAYLGGSTISNFHDDDHNTNSSENVNLNGENDVNPPPNSSVNFISDIKTSEKLHYKQVEAQMDNLFIEYLYRIISQQPQSNHFAQELFHWQIEEVLSILTWAYSPTLSYLSTCHNVSSLCNIAIRVLFLLTEHLPFLCRSFYLHLQMKAPSLPLIISSLLNASSGSKMELERWRLEMILKYYMCPIFIGRSLASFSQQNVISLLEPLVCVPHRGALALKKSRSNLSSVDTNKDSAVNQEASIRFNLCIEDTTTLHAKLVLPNLFPWCSARIMSSEIKSDGSDSLSSKTSVVVSEPLKRGWMLATTRILLNAGLSTLSQTGNPEQQQFGSDSISNAIPSTASNLLNTLPRYIIPLVSALLQWRTLSTCYFSRSSECAICFCLLHPTDRSLPDSKPCRTCLKKFHKACLYKWFKSSGDAKCPLCRSYT